MLELLLEITDFLQFGDRHGHHGEDLILPLFDNAPQTALLFRRQDGIAQHFPEVGGHQTFVFGDFVGFDGIIQFIVRPFGRGGAIAGGIQLLGDVQLLVCGSLKGNPEGFPIPLGDGKLVVGQEFTAAQFDELLQVIFFHEISSCCAALSRKD